MNIDPQELQLIAAAAAPRLDMYSGIHKALRAYMADTLLALGRMDTDDQLEVAQVSQRVLDLLNTCLSHLQHENAFVHPAIEARAPGGSEVIGHEHEDHVKHIQRLATVVMALREAPGAARPGVAQRLYRDLALFIAENLQHMQVEETAHNAVLWTRYTDEELMAIHDALVASIPPEEMMLIARWMVPFLSPAERIGLLADIRAKAPAPAFRAILDTVQPHLTQAEWGKLARGLGIAPAAGLAA